MKRATILAALLLVGCSPDPDMPMHKQTRGADSVPMQDSGRIEVTRIGVFRDDLAYNSRRGVYLIRDTKTGAEYLGVSGVGISEIGRHSAGKGTATDER
jgi:hypothetical protein